MAILYGSYSHTLISVFVISSSVFAYFVIFWLFSFLRISTLANQFEEMISYPTYWLNLMFFYLVCFPIDMFLNWIKTQNQEREVIIEKEKKIEDRKKFVKGLDLNKLAPIHRRKKFTTSKINRSWLCFQWRARKCTRNCR